MDFTKTRCNVCFKHFCCSAHRADHQVKHHTEIFSKRKQDYLVRVFEKKAEKLIMKSQKRQESSKSVNEKRQNVDTKDKTSLRLSRQLPAVKRLHSEINKRIYTTSVSFVSETRRILVPVHRLKSYNVLKDEPEIETKEPVVATRELHADITPRAVIKTSTPITSSLSIQKTPQIIWNDISPASTISNYETPPDVVTNGRFEEQAKLQVIKAHSALSPLRGIISKVTKYGNDSVGPSPLSFHNSRSRRVTFSFTSQSSSGVSPLTSIKEVEDNAFLDEKGCIEEIVTNSVSSCQEADQLVLKGSTNENKVFEDSSLYNKESGFFSCVTNIFCSAVHTIPSLGSWRKVDTDRALNRSASKRLRAETEQEMEASESPQHKRPCYQCDLRSNPIRSRKPIGDSQLQ